MAALHSGYYTSALYSILYNKASGGKHPESATFSCFPCQYPGALPPEMPLFHGKRSTAKLSRFCPPIQEGCPSALDFDSKFCPQGWRLGSKGRLLNLTLLFNLLFTFFRAEKTMTATDVTGFDAIFSTGFCRYFLQILGGLSY